MNLMVEEAIRTLCRVFLELIVHSGNILNARLSDMEKELGIKKNKVAQVDSEQENMRLNIARNNGQTAI